MREKKSAREQDKDRQSSAKTEKKKQPKEEKRVKTTVIQTLPYDRFVTNYIMVNRSNVKVGHETVNIYSKTYLVPDINYTALTEDQQEEKLRQFADLLNHFDSSVSVQISLVKGRVWKLNGKSMYRYTVRLARCSQCVWHSNGCRSFCERAKCIWDLFLR